MMEAFPALMAVIVSGFPQDLPSLPSRTYPFGPDLNWTPKKFREKSVLPKPDPKKMEITDFNGNYSGASTKGL